MEHRRPLEGNVTDPLGATQEYLAVRIVAGATTLLILRRKVMDYLSSGQVAEFFADFPTFCDGICLR